MDNLFYQKPAQKQRNRIELDRDQFSWFNLDNNRKKQNRKAEQGQLDQQLSSEQEEGRHDQSIVTGAHVSRAHTL